MRWKDNHRFAANLQKLPNKKAKKHFRASWLFNRISKGLIPENQTVALHIDDDGLRLVDRLGQNHL